MGLYYSFESAAVKFSQPWKIDCSVFWAPDISSLCSLMVVSNFLQHDIAIFPNASWSLKWEGRYNIEQLYTCSNTQVSVAWFSTHTSDLGQNDSSFLFLTDRRGFSMMSRACFRKVSGHRQSQLRPWLLIPEGESTSLSRLHPPRSQSTIRSVCTFMVFAMVLV